jgi:hypothetical protein
MDSFSEANCEYIWFDLGGEQQLTHDYCDSTVPIILQEKNFKISHS